MRRVLKWDVPVDDRWHPVGAGPVVHVACQFSEKVVQVWTDESDTFYTPVKAARVYGTGQPLPDNVTVEGTAVVAGGELVWHLIREARE